MMEIKSIDSIKLIKILKKKVMDNLKKNKS
jgi:hypothetical protein